jgi:hypothetical protein
MSNTITLRSVYGKVKKYYFQPLRMKNGLFPSFVKRVRMNPDGYTEMILSEAEMNSPERDYFIPEDMIIYVEDGKSFDLDNPYEKNLWEAIKESDLIAPERDAKDAQGNYLIDGNIRRYGMAELYIDRPGVEAQRRVSRIQLINKAYNYVTDDNPAHRRVICKLLGKSMDGIADADVQDYLYSKAETNPNLIIEIYTSSDQAMKLLIIEARQKNVIKNQSGIFMYADTTLGMTDEAMILFLKDPKNKAIYDSLKYEVYPEMKALSRASKKDDKKDQD